MSFPETCISHFDAQLYYKTSVLKIKRLHKFYLSVKFSRIATVPN